uniref:Uncharacterized protein n=1 Tax=Knipowitschia caucasica TaxID=637954 RepID=A0AAV2MQX0_KNICA
MGVATGFGGLWCLVFPQTGGDMGLEVVWVRASVYGVPGLLLFYVLGSYLGVGFGSLGLNLVMRDQCWIGGGVWYWLGHERSLGGWGGDTGTPAWYIWGV